MPTVDNYKVATGGEVLFRPNLANSSDGYR